MELTANRAILDAKTEKLTALIQIVKHGQHSQHSGASEYIMQRTDMTKQKLEVSKEPKVSEVLKKAQLISH